MPFRIISLNVDSIVSIGRKTLLDEFINDNSADVYLLQETKLDSRIKLYFPNFNIIRGDVRRGFGGTAIFIRHGIPVRNVSIGRGSINSTSVEIKLNSAWYRIFSIYVTHGCNDILNAYSNIFNVTKMGFVMGGDFNSRHTNFGDISNNVYGIRLMECVDLYGLNVYNPFSPTCFHSTNGSFIDKFIASKFPLPISNINNIPSFSDHFAISIHIDCELPPSINSKHKLSNFHLTNLRTLNRFIDTRLGELQIDSKSSYSNAQLDSFAVNIDNIFKSAIDRVVPKTSLTKRTIILSHATRALQSESKRLQRILFRSNGLLNHEFANSLRNRISLLKNMINRSVNSEVAVYFGKLYDNVKNTRDSFKLIRRFTGLKSSYSATSGLFTDDTKQTLLTERSLIADALGERFASNHKLSVDCQSKFSPAVDTDNRLVDCVNGFLIDDNVCADIIDSGQLELVDTFLPQWQRGLLTSSDEVSRVICERPNKKSSGSDTMPFFLIKNFCPSIILFLTIFFNLCIANAHFPSSWKHAIITAIPKPGRDASVISNWRPISQLNCVSKIFERIIMIRINRLISSMDLFRDQFGFLAGNSTNHALARLQADIDGGLNIGKITSILALDLKAAFDVVWHDGLIHKLCKLGFSPILIKIIKTMLSGRTFSVRLGEYFSRSFSMPAGVPQGSVSGPTLFNLYLHDIPTIFNLICTQFADDTTYHLTHNNPGLAQNSFNLLLKLLFKYFNDWKLVLNHDKTEFINILGLARDTNSSLRRRAKNMRISSGGRLIRHSGCIRLLGMQLQTNNRFIKHIDLRLKKARVAKFHLNRFFKRRKIPINIRCNVYKMYVRPILTYASPVWFRRPNSSSHQIERLRSFERGILRTATGSFRERRSFKHVNASLIYNRARCMRIDRYMAIHHVNFYRKLHTSGNIKFGRIISRRLPGRQTYSAIDYLYALHNDGRLPLNDQFSLFNTRYNGLPGHVYSLNQ